MPPSAPPRGGVPRGALFDMTRANFPAAHAAATALLFARGGRRALGSFAVLGLLCAAQSTAAPPQDQPGQYTGESVVAGPKPADTFHPDRATPVTPLYGGRV